MRNSEIDSLNNAYQTFVRLVISEGPVDQLGEVATADVMGYGTTIDEIIHDLTGLKNVARLQREQTPDENFHYNASPVFRKVINQGRSAIFVDEIQLNFVFDGQPMSFQIRLSTIMELLDGTWKAVHFHASKPEYDSGGNDPWHKEEWQKKNEELQMLVDQKTADLELKNKELEIETALEKVRTTAMSMQKPDDILDVCKTISDQLEKLNINNIRNTQVAIIDELNKNYLNYQYFTPYSKKVFEVTDYENHPTSQAMVGEMQKSANNYFTGSMQGEQLQSFSEWRKKYDQFPDPLLDKTPAVYYYFYSIGKGGLGLTTYQAISESELNIFKRFHKVFELAYSRFHDIQKAEAQAREAQIEAALERLRSRSMAMHKSEELADLSFELVKQVQALGVPSWFCAFNIYDDDEKGSLEWGSNAQGTYEAYRTPREGIFLRYYEAGQKGETFLINEIGENECATHYNYLCSLPGVGEQLLNMKDAGIPFPTSQIDHAAYFKFGYILFITFEPAPEAYEIFKRFAKVFEQTYTRFLDLQKAEASAREAQIEAALEKVRSRSLAMHKSEELLEVADVLFQQLRNFGGDLWASGVGLCKANSDDDDFYFANENGILPLVSIPHTKDPAHKKMYDGWRSKKELLVETKDGKELNAHYNYMQSIPAVKGFFQEIIDAGLSFPKWQRWHAAYFSHGYLLLITTSPYAEEQLLIRFTKVFQQAYTRFLDLKNAEAQAREAQIEASLERVRGRTLAMHNSEELAETAAVVFKQLIDLGISPNRLYIGIIKDDSGDIEFWATDEDGTKISTKFTGNKNLNESVNKMYANWTQQQKSLTIDMRGKELEDYLNYIGGELHVPFKQRHKHKRRIQTIAFFSKGFIGIASPDEQPKETTRLLERFASGFNLTFTRFNDLKIAEANALKSQQDLIEIKEARKKAEDALLVLQATQKQLIQSEKMASLGELTAGIAHEIQNPLNFVNNFSEVSVDLIDELNEEIDGGNTEEVKAISGDLKSNLKKISHHGHRASSIVKGMLEHSRTGDGKKELTDINALADEYLRLSYHGLRAKDKSFNADFKFEADEKLPKIEVVPQDIGRVLLNLMNNAFYACAERSRSAVHEKTLTGFQTLSGFEPGKPYKPIVIVLTKNLSNKIEIQVKDNGNGIPDAVKEKIFQPFFTTKPTGLGTGLGLSLSYDIIHAHGGDLQVRTKEGLETIFIITLPA